MSDPIILSDDEQESPCYLSPLPTKPKKPRIEPYQNPPTTTSSYFVIDDDPTPRKAGSSSTPLFVPDTPMSGFSKSDVCIVKCTSAVLNPDIRASSYVDDPKICGTSGLVCLGSDTDSEGGAKKEKKKVSSTLLDFDSDTGFESRHQFLNAGTSVDTLLDFDSETGFQPSPQFLNPRTTVGNLALDQISRDGSSYTFFSEENNYRAHNISDEGHGGFEEMDGDFNHKSEVVLNAEKKKRVNAGIGKKNNTKEEKLQLMEEKKLKKEEEKRQKEALKIEAANTKKLEKEKQKWEKGKFAEKSIVAEIDSKVVELGSVGGHLLSRFAEKGFKYRIASNPIKGSIVWTMTVPEEISELSPKGFSISYILLVYEAEEFCNLVKNDAITDHVSSIRSRYPSSTICYLTNRLMAYINKREQGQYKNPTSNNGWKRPPVEEVFAKLTTHFHQVHSRLCVDEAEVADHVVGLTSSLASCQFRKKLTRLSVNANGSMVSKDFVDKKLIKSNLWLKALVAIPKVQPRFAMAIWKKYPTMKSLLSIYMDSSKSVHEKEFMLKDLMVEGLLGGDDRRLGEICSKRIYRILMAESGSIKTDDVEDGADFF